MRAVLLLTGHLRSTCDGDGRELGRVPCAYLFQDHACDDGGEIRYHQLAPPTDTEKGFEQPPHVTLIFVLGVSPGCPGGRVNLPHGTDAQQQRF